ncbi:MAG: PEP-CTERM sorting domain-containing protein, partial [Phycisphaerae bacterium]|nr:PEP-CTERM sorting domain-containing protein [Gemmatimonadaceae bacterium]
MRITRVVVAALSVLAVKSASAQTTTMDFSSLQPFGNYDDLAQTFGDHANLNVSNQTRVGFGNATTLCGNVDLWNAGYSNLPTAAFACTDGNVGEFSFLPGAGKQVTISSLRVGSYPSDGITGPARNFTLNIYNSSFASLYSYTGVITTSLTLNPNVTNGGLTYLQWGTDWNTGLNEITTDVTNIRVQPPITAVPEPATIVLLSAGLAGLMLAK